MSKDQLNQLNQLEDRVNSLKEEKIRTEEQLKNLRAQKDKIISELATFKVVPDNLDNVIQELEIKINTELVDIDTQIPKDIT